MCLYRAAHRPLAALRLVQWQKSRFLSNSSDARIQHVTALPDWDLNQFRENSFIPQVPAVLPYTEHTLLRACSEWFIHENNPLYDLSKQPKYSELKTSFWSQSGDTMVPLELSGTGKHTANQESVFNRHEAPLKILLTYLGKTRLSSRPVSEVDQQTSLSMYLAQCDLGSLPVSLQEHLPTPTLVQAAGRGDIYSSSLWLGRPPTYTPLHRDPNPNLFIQLAGHKHVRLLPPEVGNVVFDTVQEHLATWQTESRHTPGSASFRGEEMMQGPEMRLLHKMVWGNDGDDDGEAVLQGSDASAYALEARLGLGDALFIPKGWWHSVKGVGEGVTASANWWFR